AIVGQQPEYKRGFVAHPGLGHGPGAGCQGAAGGTAAAGARSAGGEGTAGSSRLYPCSRVTGYCFRFALVFAALLAAAGSPASDPCCSRGPRNTVFWSQLS